MNGILRGKKEELKKKKKHEYSNKSSKIVVRICY